MTTQYTERPNRNNTSPPKGYRYCTSTERIRYLVRGESLDVEPFYLDDVFIDWIIRIDPLSKD